MQRSTSSPSRLCCSAFSVSVLNFFLTSPNSGVKCFWGFLRSEKIDFALYFCWLCGSQGGEEAVLQLQHRDDVGAGWGAERAVQMRMDRAVWLEPGWRGRYRVAARGQRWWGWHMTWQADRGEGVPVRKEWGGELPG